MKFGSQMQARVATEDSHLPSQGFKLVIYFGIDSLFFNDEVFSFLIFSISNADWTAVTCRTTSYDIYKGASEKTRCR
jgi:hypothetical protein